MDSWGLTGSRCLSDSWGSRDSWGLTGSQCLSDSWGLRDSRVQQVPVLRNRVPADTDLLRVPALTRVDRHHWDCKEKDDNVHRNGSDTFPEENKLAKIAYNFF